MLLSVAAQPKPDKVNTIPSDTGIWVRCVCIIIHRCVHTRTFVHTLFIECIHKVFGLRIINSLTRAIRIHIDIDVYIYAPKVTLTATGQHMHTKYVLISSKETKNTVHFLCDARRECASHND